MENDLQWKRESERGERVMAWSGAGDLERRGERLHDSSPGMGLRSVSPALYYGAHFLISAQAKLN